MAYLVEFNQTQLYAKQIKTDGEYVYIHDFISKDLQAVGQGFHINIKENDSFAIALTTDNFDELQSKAWDNIRKNIAPLITN